MWHYALLTKFSVKYQTIWCKRRPIQPTISLYKQPWMVSGPISALRTREPACKNGADIKCAVDGQKYHVSECNTKNVVFSFAQMIAHHSHGGCALRPGDLLATGTISGPSKELEGCFMELSYSGTRPYTLHEKGKRWQTIERAYLEDGDEVIFTSQLKRSDGQGNVGFGACQGRILPGI